MERDKLLHEQVDKVSSKFHFDKYSDGLMGIGNPDDRETCICIHIHLHWRSNIRIVASGYLIYG